MENTELMHRIPDSIEVVTGYSPVKLTIIGCISVITYQKILFQ